MDGLRRINSDGMDGWSLVINNNNKYNDYNNNNANKDGLNNNGMEVSIVMGVPQNRCFIKENLGVLLFQETSD